ncbi:MAG: globin domain-containing protein [Promicromonosporaceae bacterium]|nr:globin domain-containing protein [Promicromonosporaceae bacterium]
MDKNLLTESLLLVDGQEQALTPRFYEILFERHPEVRPLFSADIAPQEQMLREAIVAVLDHLEDAAWLTGTLGAMGRKHVGYGVTPGMYDAVGESMIAAMQELGGDAWTPEMTAAWTEALGAVSGLMLAGAEADPA